MEASLLFRKKAALTEDGLDWLKGSDEFPFTARRNVTGRAAVSAILVRALLAALEGHVLQVTVSTASLAAQVTSKTTPGAATWCWVDGSTWYLPHGEPNKITYHLGVLFIARALAEPTQATDFWSAYAGLLADYQAHGKTVAIKESLVRAGDELYYFGRYRDAAVDAANDCFPAMDIAETTRSPSRSGVLVDIAPLTDSSALRRLLPKTSGRRSIPAPRLLSPISHPGFVGWQVRTLATALRDGLNALLAGPTGTGKSFAVQQAVLDSAATLVTIEGKEGLTDLDFLGAILPQPDNTRRWVDGPILRALRQAQYEPVVLFLDEINRVRREYLNILLGLMNPKSAELCTRQGLSTSGDGPFYLIEVPMTSEVIWCPTAHLRIVGAGNFGSDYAVYPLDPAVRRRFDVVVEFDYLNLEQEQALVESRTRVTGPVARALCLVAQYTRQMRRNGDLPGCIDTASLLGWARQCAQARAATVAEVMALGKLVWADLACGRDHLGLMRSSKFDGLTDYLVSQGTLPKGGVQNAEL